MNCFEHDFGALYKSEKFLAFFGNTSADLPQLQNTFPLIKFLRVRQTHSDIVIPASEVYTEADAHYTSQLNTALVVATADCMPIMIYCEQTNRAAAVHAGWRGVVNGITARTLNTLNETGSSKRNFKIFIGPSILQDSFEVDQDVYKKLAAASGPLKESEFCYMRGIKYHINLPKIVESQIRNISPDAEIHFTAIDTKTNLNFFSYRRGKQNSERNLSFISLI